MTDVVAAIADSERKTGLKILLVDDDAEDLTILQHQFSKVPDFKIELDAVSDVNEARRLIRTKDYDIHFVDLYLGRLSGIDIMLEALRHEVQKLFVIVTGDGDEELAARSIKMGALDYLPKSKVEPGRLRGILHGFIIEAQERAERIRRMHESIFDTVTGTHRNESFCRVGAHLIASNITCTEYWGVVYVDVDGFHHMNSDLGELESDDTLRQVAEVIRREADPDDLVGRVANDEFCVLKCIGGQEDVIDLAGRIQGAVDEDTPASVSIGIAFSHADDSRLDDMIRRAEAAMQRARKRGGNGFSAEDE